MKNGTSATVCVCAIAICIWCNMCIGQSVCVSVMVWLCVRACVGCNCKRELDECSLNLCEHAVMHFQSTFLVKTFDRVRETEREKAILQISKAFQRCCIGREAVNEM